MNLISFLLAATLAMSTFASLDEGGMFRQYQKSCQGKDVQSLFSNKSETKKILTLAQKYKILSAPTIQREGERFFSFQEKGMKDLSISLYSPTSDSIIIYGKEMKLGDNPRTFFEDLKLVFENESTYEPFILDSFLNSKYSSPYENEKRAVQVLIVAFAMKGLYQADQPIVGSN